METVKHSLPEIPRDGLQVWLRPRRQEGPASQEHPHGGARTVSRHQQCKGDGVGAGVGGGGGGASKRELITTQSSGTKTEMAGMKRDRQREPSRDVRQEEAKRNTERRQQERLKRQSALMESYRGTERERQRGTERTKRERERQMQRNF